MKRNDTVRFTAQFLRSTGQYAGDEAPTSTGPWAKGTVVALSPKQLPGPVVARVLWADGREGASLVSNLEVVA